ncbi:MAG TPA: cupredoxin domain-containing protein [Acidimicrobiia bacterium]|nr:cupredoxin domain-containing protein [Acidimicrobiia bacterium]
MNRFLAASVLLPAVLAVGCGGGHDQSARPADAPRAPTTGHGALPAEATRTVEIRMTDGLRFDPDRITVRPGEVVTFHVVNTGTQTHEFTLGDESAQELHDYQMAAMEMSGATMPGMEAGGMGAMPMGKDPTHDKYRAALRKEITRLDRQAGANVSVHVLPGQSGDVTWAFTAPKAPTFGCHIPGHWKGGMQGTIVLAG